MSEYSATISWQRGASEPFVDQRYSRAHEWAFDGGVRVPASSSPQVVPLPWSVAEHVDPEEAFVASLSSCHMLTFLWLVARAGYLVESYRAIQADTSLFDKREPIGKCPRCGKDVVESKLVTK